LLRRRNGSSIVSFLRLLYTPFAFAIAIPYNCLSLIIFIAISATTPKMMMIILEIPFFVPSSFNVLSSCFLSSIFTFLVLKKQWF
jgi:hypothetical protein